MHCVATINRRQRSGDFTILVLQEILLSQKCQPVIRTFRGICISLRGVPHQQLINKGSFVDWKGQSQSGLSSAQKPVNSCPELRRTVSPTNCVVGRAPAARSSSVLPAEYSNCINSSVGFFVSVNGYFNRGFIGPQRFSCLIIGPEEQRDHHARYRSQKIFRNENL